MRHGEERSRRFYAMFIHVAVELFISLISWLKLIASFKIICRNLIVLIWLEKILTVGGTDDRLRRACLKVRRDAAHGG